MARVLRSDARGWKSALVGTTAEWASSVSEDDVGPTHESLRNSRTHEAGPLARPSAELRRTRRSAQAVRVGDARPVVRPIVGEHKTLRKRASRLAA